MRHAVRIVVLVVVTFLVARPVWAGYACAGPCKMAASGHRCCMRATHESVRMPPMAGCSMPPAPVAAQACCNLEIASALQDPAKAQLFSTVDGKKLHAVIAVASVWIAVPQARKRGPGAAPVTDTRSERRAMFHVFRI
jgi:hypothetical protein